MGLRVVVLAARGKDRANVLADLGLVATGQEGKFHEADVSGTWVGEWYVVVTSNRSAFRPHIDDALLAKTATGAELIACGIDEGNNVTFALGLRDGREGWSVVHNANLADRHLVIGGDAPREAVTIAARLAAEADADEDGDVDYLSDVPIQLLAALTGFKPLSGCDELRYDVLVPAGAHQPPSDEASRYMEIDGRPAVHWPLACEVMATIDAMTPHGGPGFVILQGADTDYMQTAGGDGVYLAEWREHEGGAFGHFVAGRPERAPPGMVQIPTSSEHGRYVLAHINEMLAADEVKRLARAFLNGEPRPEAFAWRDITAMFD